MAQFFNGTIDEVRIWNRSLSADEIYQQYVSNLKKIDSDSWELYVNQSLNASDGLTDGDYTYQAFASDILSGGSNTEKRTVTIDATPPTINFVSPTTAAGGHPQTYITANVTATDANLNTIDIKLYNLSNAL